MPLPFTAIILRREPNVGRDLLPVRVNRRVTEQITPDVSPDPIRQSEVWAQGKPIEHAYSRQTIAIPAMAADAYHAVMQDAFGVESKIAYDAAISGRAGAVPISGQMPYRERINIQRNPPGSYGAGFVLDPTVGMGVSP